METARTYYSQNSGFVKTVIYVIVTALLIYYIYGWYSTPTTDLLLSNVKTAANQVTTATISTGALPAIRSGGAYTLSLWMYINSYEYRAGRPKRVFTLVDSKVSNRALAVGILYPTEPKLMIRFATANPPGTDYTNLDTLNRYLSGSQYASPDSNPIELPSCDVHEIDLQRWVHLTISVNGRIVDVYMDGKLTRSCVLSDLPIAGQDGTQQITFGGPDGFSGYFGTVQFNGSAVSPDKIYSLYQAGPYTDIDSGFLGFIATKLGIKLQYGSSAPATTLPAAR
jgi:hypothetical protein